MSIGQPFVKSLKFFAVGISQARGLVRAEKRPIAIGLNTLHEEIRRPESIEQVTRADLLLAVVLAEIQELKDVGVPRLQVDSKGTRALVATLVHVPGRVVVHPEHRHDAIRRPVGSSNVRAGGSNSVDVEANPTGRLGDHGTCLQGVVDALNAIFLHINQEARSQLRLGSAGVEQSRRGMCEVLLRHQVIGLDGLLDILAMDSHGNSHQQMLRTLRNLPINAEEVRPLQSLEAEEVVVEVTVVHNGRVELVRMFHYNLVYFLRHHGCRLIIFRIHIVVKI